jgi:hypothetical protein
MTPYEAEADKCRRMTCPLTEFRRCVHGACCYTVVALAGVPGPFNSGHIYSKNRIPTVKNAYTCRYMLNDGLPYDNLSHGRVGTVPL